MAVACDRGSGSPRRPPAAPRSLGAGLDRASGIRVEVDAETSGDLSDEEELVVYRVAEEVLTNAVSPGAGRRIGRGCAPWSAAWC